MRYNRAVDTAIGEYNIVNERNLMRIPTLILIACPGIVGCVDSVVDKSNIAEAPTTMANKEGVDAPTPTIETASHEEASMPGQSTSSQYNELSKLEKHVLLNKGTERAFTGEYTDLEDKGTYVCRRCNAALYLSDHKFHSSCGWPAFDDEIEGAVTHLPDADGLRTEIICTNCGGHLGHVFVGERITDKNTRHCVNSVSMKFVAADDTMPKAISSDSTE